MFIHSSLRAYISKGGVMGIAIKIQRGAVVSAAVLSAVAVLTCSDTVRGSVRDGISLCLTSVIPSLFLFTAIALFISYSGVSSVLGRLVSPVFRLIFGLDGALATAFLLSAVSGYPVGARLIDSHYQNGSVTRAKALKMLTFSVNAGPAFIVTAVGKGVLGSGSDGWRLVLAHFTASCILAATARLLPDRLFAKNGAEPASPTVKSTLPLSLSDVFVRSVNDAAKTMLSVCGFVVFFAGVGGVVKALPYGGLAQGFLEVTVGVQSCSRQQLSKVAFLLGFGGISVIFQVLSSAKCVRPPISLIVVSRVLHGAVSAGIILLLEIISPRTLSAGSFGIGGTPAVYTSPFAAVALLVLCVALLVFTSNTVKRLKNNS